MISNYMKYRGKCKEFCEELVSKNSHLEMVRGWYYDPIWNRKEPHWWCKDKEGKIHDPTSLQFAAGGIESFYEEFTGTLECEMCGNEVLEEETIPMGNYRCCSVYCAKALVGI